VKRVAPLEIAASVMAENKFGYGAMVLIMAGQTMTSSKMAD
jgi:hypothetical protein